MTRQPTPNVLDDVLAAGTTRPTVLRFRDIKTDGGTQMRASLNKDTVAEYQEEFLRAKGWGNFPPAIVFYDGADYWLGDGFHRMAALRETLYEEMSHVHCDVRSGTRRDAILYAAGANAIHGLRRTNADKRRAVETLLRDDEWAKWSNVEIARRCKVSESTVRNIRGELERTSQIAKSDERHGADGRTTNTANIGAKPQPSTPKQFAAAVRAATWGERTVVDVLPPSDAPLPAWAQEKAAAHSDERLPAAQRLRGLYQAVIDSEDEYGNLTGDFSGTLAVKRELKKMIGHLDWLINAIEHPEVTE